MTATPTGRTPGQYAASPRARYNERAELEKSKLKVELQQKIDGLSKALAEQQQQLKDVRICRWPVVSWMFTLAGL